MPFDIPEKVSAKRVHRLVLAVDACKEPDDDDALDLLLTYCNPASKNLKLIPFEMITVACTRFPKRKN